MKVMMNLPLFGYLVECKRKDLEGESALFYIKVNSYTEAEALEEVRRYIADRYIDCEVVKVDTTYSYPFMGIIN